MTPRVVEDIISSGRFGRTLRLRIDLHGVSSFGPGKHRTMIRWEWITGISAQNHGVIIESDKDELVFPSGSFGLAPAALADRLTEAGSIFKRADVLLALQEAASGS